MAIAQKNQNNSYDAYFKAAGSTAAKEHLNNQSNLYNTRYNSTVNAATKEQRGNQGKPQNGYYNAAIGTAAKEQLTLTLYDGALRFTNQAIDALNNKDLIKMNEAVKKAMDVVWELQRTLNMQYEISQNMDALYSYIRECLVTANSNRDRIVLEETRDLLREFRETWHEAITSVKKNSASRHTVNAPLSSRV